MQTNSEKPLDVLMEFNALLGAGRIPEAIARIGKALQNFEGRADITADTVLAFKTTQELARQLLSERRNSTIDYLTGIYNRKGFYLTMRAQIEHVVRHHNLRTEHGDVNLAVTMIDLNGFKEVNDKFGHGAGDQIIKEVAQRLANSFRKTDVVCRLGGDEFAIILTYDEGEVFDKERVQLKITEALDGLVLWCGDKPYPITASVGSALYIHDKGQIDQSLDEEIKRLSDHADQAMYLDKARYKAVRQAKAAEAALASRQSPSAYAAPDSSEPA